MRILQVIDTLQPGGAERMAISYAKLLQKNNHKSFICCTRAEGILKESLYPEIGYLFLNKKSSLDLSAFIKLRNYILDNKIEIVHAHSTSYFFASLLKLTRISIKLVWHDHYGESELLKFRKHQILKTLSPTFDGIISVNKKLKEWAIQKLKSKNVIMINNFVTEEQVSNFQDKLKGSEKSFKIICLANLRPQKDHLNLLKSFELLCTKINVTLHLIGNNPNTSHSRLILDQISTSKNRDRIYYYGLQKNVMFFLKQADLGVLTSRSEGLPLALLEYGKAGIPVLVTDVGQCLEVVNGYGEIVLPNDSNAFFNAVLEYYKNENKRFLDAQKFQHHILMEYSEDVILKKIVEFYVSL